MNRASQIVLLLVIGLQLSGLVSSQAYASSETCSSIDLRKTFPLKIRDQGDISWCYANAAADYLQFLYKLPEQISAADIAIQYNLRGWPLFLNWIQGKTVAETGFIRSALWGTLESGYCLESDFPSDLWTKRILTGKDAGKVEKKFLKASFTELFQLQDLIQKGIYKTEAELPFRYEFNHITPALFFEILKNNSQAKVLNALRIPACEKSRTPFAHSIDAIAMKVNSSGAFQKIDTQLNRGMAVTVDFFYGVLDNVNHYSTAFSEFHTALLYGRRFNAATQECQYLIKNSYGSGCSEYDAHNQCEGGYVWLAQKDLSGAMFSYEYVKDPMESAALAPVDAQDSQSAPLVP